ncbi:DNA translocase FtsK, partial [Methylobacterium organophilum]
AASIMERMEIEGIVGPANHAGKREILVEEAVG